jgi:hypothetical protein
MIPSIAAQNVILDRLIIVASLKLGPRDTASIGITGQGIGSKHRALKKALSRAFCAADALEFRERVERRADHLASGSKTDIP